jgi:hypothetical protein
MACYMVSYLNPINIGSAKLQMSATQGLSESVFGMGAGVLFIDYFISWTAQQPCHVAHWGAPLD